MRRVLLLSSIVMCSSSVIASFAAGEPPIRSHGDEALERAIVHRTVEAVQAERAARGPGRSTHELTYNGGIADGGAGTIGVETAPQIYLVLWGSQWNNNDPSGESQLLQTFLSGVGGSNWLRSVTQYCQGLSRGTTFCNGGGAAAESQTAILAGVWYDNSSAAPTQPQQSQIAAEAVRAASYWGNTTATSNARVQYVIATATGNNSSGFGTQYCAYHSATTSSYGDIAYTNLPYITDAGASCGANFNGLGANAGITIVEGHEAAETITDQFPNGGWLDASGSENGDKCAWISSGQGAATGVAFTSGTFPVQSLWSNAFNNDTGGCVLSYP
jgi:serine protease